MWPLCWWRQRDDESTLRRTHISLETQDSHVFFMFSSSFLHAVFKKDFPVTCSLLDVLDRRKWFMILCIHCCFLVLDTSNSGIKKDIIFRRCRSKRCRDKSRDKREWICLCTHRALVIPVDSLRFMCGIRMLSWRERWKERNIVGEWEACSILVKKITHESRHDEWNREEALPDFHLRFKPFELYALLMWKQALKSRLDFLLVFTAFSRYFKWIWKVIPA